MMSQHFCFTFQATIHPFQCHKLRPLLQNILENNSQACFLKISPHVFQPKLGLDSPNIFQLSACSDCLSCQINAAPVRVAQLNAVAACLSFDF